MGHKKWCTSCQQKSSFHSLPLSESLVQHIVLPASVPAYIWPPFSSKIRIYNARLNKGADHTTASKVRKSPSFIWNVSRKYSNLARNILQEKKIKICRKQLCILHPILTSIQNNNRNRFAPSRGKEGHKNIGKKWRIEYEFYLASVISLPAECILEGDPKHDHKPSIVAIKVDTFCDLPPVKEWKLLYLPMQNKPSHSTIIHRNHLSGPVRSNF